MDAPYKLKRPAKLCQFIIRQADKTYLVFDRKTDTVLCTRCGKVHKLSEMNDGEYFAHNKRHWCYDCRREAICKEKRYGRKNITEFGRVLWFTKRGPVTYAQLDEYQIDYTGDVPKVYFWDSAQFKLSAKEQCMHKHVPENCWHGDYWYEKKNAAVPAPFTGFWTGTTAKWEKTVLFPEVKLGTDLQYANPDMRRFRNDPYIVMGYLRQFLKYPAIEMLDKAGFDNLVKERALGQTCRAINWRGKDLRKVLKLNSEEIRQLKEQEESFGLLIKYKELHRVGIYVNFEEAVYMDSYPNERALEKLQEYGMDALKAIRYMVEQNAKYDRYNGLTDYEDYIRFCRLLKLDLSNRKIVRPKDFVKAHDRLERVAAEMGEEIDTLAFRDTQQKLTRMDAPFEKDGFLIRPAEKPEELTQESAVLGHCVRTYKDRVCRGHTSILFVRRIEEPERPLYTLELDYRGEIVQCRGKSNCAMTQEVKAFVDAWYAAWKKEHKEAA